MSKRTGPEVKFKCANDCQQSGCPGHIMRVVHDLSTDIYIFEIEGEREPKFCIDENVFHAMMEAYQLL